jgi:hypothetical protein
MTQAIELRTRSHGTDHEELPDKYCRIRSEVWGEYSALTDTLQREPRIPAFHIRPLNVDTAQDAWLCFVEVLADAPVWNLRDEPLARRKAAESLDVELSRALCEYFEVLQRATVTWSQVRSFDTATAWLFRAVKHATDVPTRSTNLRRAMAVQTDPEWTDAKNVRRCELVDKEIEGTLSRSETLELDPYSATRDVLQARADGGGA